MVCLRGKHEIIICPPLCKGSYAADRFLRHLPLNAGEKIKKPLDKPQIL